MKRKWKIAAIVGAIAGVAGAGVGYALWSATATGPGQAKALSAVTVTVAAGTGAADLYPGFTQGDVYFTVTNTNPYPVTFASMTAGAITSSNTPACLNSNITVANVASGLNLLVAAGATSAPQSIANVVTMIPGAPDACQGVTFDIALTLTGSQS